MLLCLFVRRTLSGSLNHPHSPLLFCICSCSDTPADLHVALSRIEAQPWLATEVQRCPLVRAAYLGVADSLRGFCSETFLMELSETVTRGLKGAAEEELQVQDTH